MINTCVCVGGYAWFYYFTFMESRLIDLKMTWSTKCVLWITNSICWVLIYKIFITFVHYNMINSITGKKMLQITCNDVVPWRFVFLEIDILCCGLKYFPWLRLSRWSGHYSVLPWQLRWRPPRPPPPPPLPSPTLHTPWCGKYSA